MSHLSTDPPADPGERRLRRMFTVSTAGTAVMEFGWSGYYAYRGEWLVVALIVAAGLALAGAFVLARQRLYEPATYLMLGTVFVAIFLSAGFLDVPSPGSPRAVHDFFIPVGVGACLLLRTSPAWVGRGFPLACFGAFIYFAGVNPVWSTRYATPEAEREIAVWINHFAALAMLYGAVGVIQNDAKQRSALELQLRDALLRNEFELHFQPQVDDAGRTVGAEALIRWRHPTRGLVFPNDFISVVESSGLMTQVGDWVLRSACRQLAEWAKDPQFAHLQLAVNVSATQFAEPGFERRVVEIVQRAGAPATRLKLELTESVLAHDMEGVIVKMEALKKAGLTLSLDDFGTGFSSLSYLRRMPFDQLKIDQGFVRNMQASTKDAAIVQAVLTLGESMGMEVIAEGVETQAHHDLLSKAGCGLFQGYLFSRPVSAADFAARIRQIEAEKGGAVSAIPDRRAAAVDGNRFTGRAA